LDGKDISSDLVEVDWEQFKKWGVLCNLSEESTIDAAKFLHDTGTIIHFHDNKGTLKDLVILNPQSLVSLTKNLLLKYP
jgi:hypothetical protein